MNPANPVSRVIASGGQKLFLLTLSFAAVLGSVGFSLAVFGTFSGLLSTGTDELIVTGIGFGLIGLGAGLTYTALN